MQGFDRDNRTSNRYSHVSIESVVFPSGECREEEEDEEVEEKEETSLQNEEYWFQ